MSDADDLARRCVAAMWEADSASRGLGMRLESVAAGTARVSIESIRRFASSANRRNRAISPTGSRSKSASAYPSSSANDTATTRTPDPRPVHRE